MSHQGTMHLTSDPLIGRARAMWVHRRRNKLLQYPLTVILCHIMLHTRASLSASSIANGPTVWVPAASPNFEAAFQGECETNDADRKHNTSTSNRNPCQHVCVDLHDGTYECTCFYGFALAVDGYSCAKLSTPLPQTALSNDGTPPSMSTTALNVSQTTMTTTAEASIGSNQTRNDEEPPKQDGISAATNDVIASPSTPTPRLANKLFAISFTNDSLQNPTQQQISRLPGTKERASLMRSPTASDRDYSNDGDDDSNNNDYNNVARVPLKQSDVPLDTSPGTPETSLDQPWLLAIDSSKSMRPTVPERVAGTDANTDSNPSINPEHEQRNLSYDIDIDTRLANWRMQPMSEISDERLARQESNNRAEDSLAGSSLDLDLESIRYSNDQLMIRLANSIKSKGSTLKTARRRPAAYRKLVHKTIHDWNMLKPLAGRNNIQVRNPNPS